MHREHEAVVGPGHIVDVAAILGCALTERALPASLGVPPVRRVWRQRRAVELYEARDARIGHIFR